MPVYRHIKPKEVGNVADGVYSISDLEKQMQEQDASK
jgi:DNA-directed RNA polymerase subunit beta'